MTQANPFEHLDLTDYACQELLVSFAVSNKEGLSNFSTAISMTINGGSTYHWGIYIQGLQGGYYYQFRIQAQYLLYT